MSEQAAREIADADTSGVVEAAGHFRIYVGAAAADGTGPARFRAKRGPRIAPSWADLALRRCHRPCP